MSITMPHRPNHAWRNLWVPVLIALVAGAAKALGFLSANHTETVLITMGILFAILLIAGLVTHLARRRRPDHEPEPRR